MAAKSYGFSAPKTGPWKCVFFEVCSAIHVGSGPLLLRISVMTPRF